MTASLYSSARQGKKCHFPLTSWRVGGTCSLFPVRVNERSLITLPPLERSAAAAKDKAVMPAWEFFGLNVMNLSSLPA